MPHPKEDAILESVIELIKILDYNGFETLEPEWVRSVLVSSGDERQTFLLWVLRQLSPSEADDMYLASKSTQTQRLLQCLSSLGVCSLNDLEIIEGTAPALAQLKFWWICLECIHNLRQFPAHTSHQRAQSDSANVLLDQLAESSCLQLTLKEGGGVSVIPGDLKNKYRALCKYGGHKGPISELLLDSAEELNLLKEEYENVNEKWKTRSTLEQDSESYSRVCESMSSMTKQQSIFHGVYTSYITPWTSAKPQLSLPNTGPLVHNAYSKLAILTKVLQSTEEASRKYQELEEYENISVRHTPHPSSVTSSLHSLVSQLNTGGK